MSHDELRELSGGYALGALTEPERGLFEPHLATCVECTDEVRELAAVASGLAQAVPQVEPSAALRARVIDAATAGSQSHVRTQTSSPGRSVRLFALLSAAAAVAAIALGRYAVSLQQRIHVLEEELRVASARATDVTRQLVQLD